MARGIRKTPMPRSFFDRVQGRDLQVGDRVAQDTDAERVFVDATLTHFVGFCDQGVHFTDSNGIRGCYDNAGYTLRVRK